MELYPVIYHRKLDEIRNELFGLYNKRMNLLSIAEKDYNSHKITQKDYNVVINSSITDALFYPLDSYCLSREERDYINQYADLYEGEITNKIIKQEVIDKEGLFSDICSSITKGEALASMSVVELRESVRRYVYDRYEEKRREYESIMNEARNRFGANAITDVRYSQASNNSAKLNTKFNSLINFINTASYEDLYKYSFELFGVNPNYYGWFKTKQITEEYNTGKTMERERQSVEKTSVDFNKAYDLLDELEKSNTSYDLFVKDYIKFIKENPNESNIISKANIIVKRSLFKKNDELRELLANMERAFNYLFDNYAIFRQYIIDVIYLGKVDNVDKVLSFKDYVNYDYKDLSKVELREFVRRLINNVLIYGEDKINILLQNKVNKQSRLANRFDFLASSINETRKCLNDINSYESIINDDKVYLLPSSVTEEEEMELYNNMIDYLNQSTKKENISRLLKKN